MGEFFAGDYHGAPFILFSTAHVVALASVVLVLGLIVIYRKSFSNTAQVRIRYALTVVLLLNEAAWHAWNYFTGQWRLDTTLPLHVCSVLVFASAYMLVTKNHLIYEFSYFLGIGAATQALLTPDAGIYGFPHFRFFQVFISHGAIVAAAFYMTFVEGYRPYWSSFRRVIVWGHVYMLFVGLVNWALGSNYMFIARKPDTASLIDVLGPWPWYILSLEAIALTMFLVLYAPYALMDYRRARMAEA